MEWVALGIGLALGVAAGWILAAARTRAALAPELRELDARARSATAAADARVEELRRGMDEQRHLLDEARARLGETFEALAARALQQSSEGFLALATERLGALRVEATGDLDSRRQAVEGMVKPVAEALARVDVQIQAMEQERGRAWGALSEQVRSLAVTQDKLRDETGNLVRALRAPAVRGRWGELQLKRAVEMAGMLEHCDFEQQATVTTDDGRLRPDMVVHLPGGQNIVVDAKVPLAAYLEAIETNDEAVRALKLREHAAQVRAHIQKLGAKSYWDQFPSAPEMVVMFLPGEAFYSVALEQMPSLLEDGIAARVMIASPTSLIMMLRAAHLGWRHEQIAENAQRISEHGRLLHERLATLVEHFNKLGSSLSRSVEAFNAAAASFDARVMPAARKLDELGAAGKKPLAALARAEGQPRLLAEPAANPDA